MTWSAAVYPILILFLLCAQSDGFVPTSSKGRNINSRRLYNSSPSLFSTEFDEPRWHRSMGTKPVYSTSYPVTSEDIRLLPIFPLDDGSVYPTGVLPLNIFAMPYRTMMNDLYSKSMVEGSELLFGLCMSDGQGGITEIGVGCEIVNRDLKPDGRQMIASVARQRFKVRRVVQEEPYIICEVEYGVEDIDVPGSESSDEITEEMANLEKEVHQSLVDIISLSNKLDVYKQGVIELPDKINLLSPKRHAIRKEVSSLYSFAVADFLNIGSKERQVLLQAPTLLYRLQKLKGLLLPSRSALMAKLSEQGEEGESFG